MKKFLTLFLVQMRRKLASLGWKGRWQDCVWNIFLLKIKKYFICLHLEGINFVILCLNRESSQRAARENICERWRSEQWLGFLVQHIGKTAGMAGGTPWVDTDVGRGDNGISIYHMLTVKDLEDSTQGSQEDFETMLTWPSGYQVTDKCILF